MTLLRVLVKATLRIELWRAGLAALKAVASYPLTAPVIPET